MKRTAQCAALLLAAGLGAAGTPLRADEPAATPPRIEVRSADYVLVGVLHGDALDIHLSRTLDNTPVRDATVSVTLRGAVHPTVAQLDGGYQLKAPELAAPGATAMEFLVASGGSAQKLDGTLQVTAAAGSSSEGIGGTARQLAWWILNFAVCGAFIVLWSRRGKKSSSGDDD